MYEEPLASIMQAFLQELVDKTSVPFVVFNIILCILVIIVFIVFCYLQCGQKKESPHIHYRGFRRYGSSA
ncbi:Hypothetical predicted protein [Cloeon dipterum]|uniref:Uncharacterized protein n=1 Tax=Cloeon dipterum TaxID=197152 RepID=A0A8S1D0D9_9INSE|nr:Hypothetical predicted protein [Cloeon dipterum]